MVSDPPRPLARRELMVTPDGAASMDHGDQGDRLALAPEAWDQWTASAAWCSIEAGPEPRRVRMLVGGAHGVIEWSGVTWRALCPATMAPGVFLAELDLWTTLPLPPRNEPSRAPGAVRSWEEGSLPDDGSWRWRLGLGDRLLDESILVRDARGWVQARGGLSGEGSPAVSVRPLSVRALVLDLSVLLREARGDRFPDAPPDAEAEAS